MKIEIPTFGLMRPKVAPHMLKSGEAQEAVNIDPAYGDLRPLAKALDTAALCASPVKTLFRWSANSGTTWIGAEDELDYRRGPIADDAYERVYYTGETQPRFHANDFVSDPFDAATDYIKLGVPAPSAALTATGYSTATTYRAYLYTFVNRYGEEGPPSPLLEKTDYGSGNVTLAGFSTPTAGHAVEFIRVYRVNASGAEYAEFQLVFASDLKIYSATATYNDGDLVVYSGALFKCVVNNTKGVTPVGSHASWDDWYDGIADANLQPDTLVSEDWELPPSGLSGLILLANGSLAGFDENTVYISEPGYPHAWPQGSYSDDYRVVLPYPVVALAAAKTAIIAMTTGPVYVIAGSAPGQMAPIKLEGHFPCVSKRSVTETPEGAMYAAKQGLIRATTEGLANVLSEIMGEKEWQAYVPAQTHGAFYDRKYIGFFNNNQGFIVDFANGGFADLDFYASALHVAEGDATLYLALPDEDAPALLRVWEWAASDVEKLYGKWKSGIVLTPAAVNFGAARVTIDEAYYQDVEEIAAENATVGAKNAAIFTAGTVAGGLAGSGLAVRGIAGDALYQLRNLNVGSTVTFKYWADGSLKKEKLISTSDVFRLPAGFRARRHEVGIEGYVPVRMVELATGTEELFK